jgi:hypothetical protein
VTYWVAAGAVAVVLAGVLAFRSVSGRARTATESELSMIAGTNDAAAASVRPSDEARREPTSPATTEPLIEPDEPLPSTAVASPTAPTTASAKPTRTHHPPVAPRSTATAPTSLAPTSTSQVKIPPSPYANPGGANR